MPSAIDPATAAQMKRILCDVVIRGTAEKARSRTWNIFGKTGTAHITKGGSYSDQAFNSSFIGGAPAEAPALIVSFIVHEPDRQKGHYGGVVSAPGAMHVLERSLAYLQVPASPDLPVPPPNIANVLYAYDANLYSNRLVNAGD
jgi:cell division protein FtsI/penicillin-binding protein 2